MRADLFIDLGNSRIKWRLGAGQPQQAVEYGNGPLDAVLNDVWKKLPSPEHIWLASVAPDRIRRALQSWTSRAWGVTPHVVTVQPEACGVSCGYQDPGQLGVDRWMAIIAAHDVCPGGACVVDCGTATTLDVLDSNGRHLGGFILPGVTMMRRILARETGLNPALGVTQSMEWGNSTASCIDLGIYKSVVSLIEQSVERLQAAGVCDPGVILTGGACSLIKPHLQLAHEHRDALVLDGMETFVQEPGK